jgi:benzodiazapine receptor
MEITMTEPRLLQTANVIAVPVTIALNAWIEMRPLNGVNSGQVSDSYPSLFTPPGWAFAIWSLIYTALLVFAIYQVRPGQRSRPYLPRIGWLHVVASVCNVSWLIVFHYSYERPALAPLTLIPMLCLFASLLTIYRRLRVGLDTAARSEKLAVHLPFSLYFGWITLATLVNCAFVLYSVLPGIPLAVQRGITVALLLVVLSVGLVVLRGRRDVVFALVIIWATVGIAIKNQAYLEIAASAGATALIIGGAIIVALRNRRQEA